MTAPDNPLENLDEDLVPDPVDDPLQNPLSRPRQTSADAEEADDRGPRGRLS